MWGSYLPIGTYMMDPKSNNIYVWTGKIWSKEQIQKKDLDLKYSSNLIIGESDSPPNYNSSTKPIKIKTKKPCKYNNFIKDMILSKKYNHLSCQERMKAIAKEWKNRES